MIELPDHLKIEDIPIEKKYRSATTELIRRIKLLYDAIYQKYGNDGLILIKDIGKKYGLEIAEQAKKHVKSNDVESVALYIIKIFNTLGGNGKVVEFSDKRVVIRVWDCPYQWENSDVCQAHTQMEKTLIETLGENLRYKITQSIPKGDPYCDHVIEYENP